MRYIRYYDVRNSLKDYLNENLLLLLKHLATKRKYYSNGNYGYKQTKYDICNYIEKNMPEYKNKISKKQLSRLIRPRKHRFSKYAPIYLTAIIEMLLEDELPEELHRDICIRGAYEDICSEFALNIIIELIYECYDGRYGGRQNDRDILFFLEKLGEFNEQYPDMLGVLFRK